MTINAVFACLFCLVLGWTAHRTWMHRRRRARARLVVLGDRRSQLVAIAFDESGLVVEVPARNALPFALGIAKASGHAMGWTEAQTAEALEVLSDDGSPVDFAPPQA